MQQPPDRIQAIRQELDDAAATLESAKADYEVARVRYETKREKFRLLKQLAQPMMTMLDWYMWNSDHPQVKYAGTELSDAILTVLQARAYESANAVVYVADKRPKYNPWMTLEEISQLLEAGGFDFRTTAPLREVNAALLNLEGREKNEAGNYAIAQSAEVLGLVKTLAERTETLTE